MGGEFWAMMMTKVMIATTHNLKQSSLELVVYIGHEMGLQRVGEQAKKRVWHIQTQGIVGRRFNKLFVH